MRQEQQVLRLARFDHGAHVIQRGCLDCHTRIPFSDYLGADEAIDPGLDNVAIQNIPTAGVCRSATGRTRPQIAASRATSSIRIGASTRGCCPDGGTARVLTRVHARGDWR